MSEPSKPSHFWKLFATCALVLCAYQVFSKGGSDVRADNGGAASNGLITLMGINPESERLFIVDAQQRILLVYEGGKNKQVRLVETRNLDADLAFATDKKWNSYPFRTDAGYDKEVAEAAARQAAKSGK